MAKSIKLKDNNYIDSTGIVHNRNTLDTLLDNIIEKINKADNLFKFRAYYKDVTIQANAIQDVTMGAINTPSGYTYIGVMPLRNGFADQWLVSYSTYGTNIVAMVHSRYQVALSNTLSCLTIYVKTDYYNDNIL